MHRLSIIVAIALLVLFQSDCLTFQNGKLSNKCGLWQYVSGGALVLLIETKEPIKEQPKILVKTVPNEPRVIIYQPSQTYTTSGSALTYMPSTSTITSMSFSYQPR